MFCSSDLVPIFDQRIQTPSSQKSHPPIGNKGAAGGQPAPWSFPLLQKTSSMRSAIPWASRNSIIKMYPQRRNTRKRSPAVPTPSASAAEEAAFLSSPSSSSSHQLDLDLDLKLEGGEDFDKMADRALNAAIVLAAGSFAITKLLTIDRDYWHGWTLYEILRYAPQHNWTAYEEALKANPVLAKMMISGVVYSLGDWIAQCYEGKPLFDFDRIRMFRSGIVGFTLHGSLSHYYYYFCEALFPYQDWWVVPAKVAFDQTIWSAIWNSIYYVVLGFLRFESPVNIFRELKATFWPMLTAGWKLWPFAHLITYGVIPVEQRLLWVDCVELVWVTILSTYSNEKSEARHLEAASESDPISPKE